MTGTAATLIAACIILLALTLEYLSRRADADLDIDTDDAEHDRPSKFHVESETHDGWQVSFCYDFDADAWRVTECNADGNVTFVDLFNNFEVAADYYDSVCDRLAEDAGRDFESEVA